ncbi:hypothetical protein D3C77_657530 [compost metagenome]
MDYITKGSYLVTGSRLETRRVRFVKMSKMAKASANTTNHLTASPIILISIQEERETSLNSVSMLRDLEVSWLSDE